MYRRKKENVKNGLAICAVVLIAFLCRRLVYVTSDRVIEQLANFTRIFLYIGLFAAWGVSVHRRVMQIQVRRTLTAVSALMVFWLTVREFRWHFVMDPAVGRFLWYAYYIPMLVIPMLALFISILLGKPEDYRLPGWTRALYSVVLALIAMVMTNDLHRLVFILPPEAGRSETDYRYGIGFYVVAAWLILISLIAFAVMLKNARSPKTRRIRWIPLIPFLTMFLYSIFYTLRVPFVVSVLGDSAVVDGLAFTAFFESCIQCGMIPSNTCYSDLFESSEGLSVQITDHTYQTRFAAKSAEHFSPDLMRRAEEAPLILPEGKRIHNMKIRGGHAVWSEDITEWLSLTAKLKDVNETLTEHLDFLRYSYEREKEYKKVDEQNRLYDILEKQTADQIREIDRLAKRYREASGPESKRSILGRIVILGTFIKRQKDLILTLDAEPTVAESKLDGAFAESFRALLLYGVKGGWIVRTERGVLPGEAPTRAYLFFEDVMEAALPELHYINVRVTSVAGALQISVLTDCAFSTETLQKKYPRMRTAPDGGGMEWTLFLEGGEAV